MQQLDKKYMMIIAGVVATVMLLALGYFLWTRKRTSVEKFATEPEEDVVKPFDLTGLTSSEKEMFTKLKDNALNEKEIDRLIGSGALTPDIMEKFMDIMDAKVMKKKN